jgi:hypothetical protein
VRSERDNVPADFVSVISELKIFHQMFIAKGKCEKRYGKAPVCENATDMILTNLLTNTSPNRPLRANH